MSGKGGTWFEVHMTRNKAELFRTLCRLEEDQVLVLREVLLGGHDCTLCGAQFDLNDRRTPGAFATATPKSGDGIAALAAICNDCVDAHSIGDLTRAIAKQLLEMWGISTEGRDMRTVREIADDMTAEMLEKLKKGRLQP